MAKLVYSAITSLDGYVEDSGGAFDWTAPDAEVHAFVNDRERVIGTYLYGRRMYETMRVWDDTSQFQSASDDPQSVAAHAFAAGFVDEVHLYLNRVVGGGGKAALPTDVRVNLELLDEHRFGNGVVHLHYGVS